MCVIREGENCCFMFPVQLRPEPASLFALRGAIMMSLG